MRRLLSVLLWVVIGCTSESSSDPEPDAGPPAAEVIDAGTAECVDEGSTRACTCNSGGAGTKTCRKGTYGTCGNCAVVKRDGGTVRSVERCKAGYYVGHMEGKYKPGFASFGISQSFFEVEFKSEALNGQPPLALTLNQNTTGSGEFTSFNVSGGCMQGLARSGNTDNPFFARLTGELDCQTGEFNGVMEGIYTLVNVEGLDYNFKGPFTGQFNTETLELDDGAWSADEPLALDGKPQGGGSGTWGAKWDADSAPDAGTDPCAKIVTLDAGVGP